MTSSLLPSKYKYAKLQQKRIDRSRHELPPKSVVVESKVLSSKPSISACLLQKTPRQGKTLSVSLQAKPHGHLCLETHQAPDFCLNPPSR